MHRTSSKSKSLKVQRETVRVLASAALSSVYGGAGGFAGQDTVGQFTQATCATDLCPRPDIGDTATSISMPVTACTAGPITVRTSRLTSTSVSNVP